MRVQYRLAFLRTFDVKAFGPAMTLAQAQEWLSRLQPITTAQLVIFNTQEGVSE